MPMTERYIGAPSKHGVTKDWQLIRSSTKISLGENWLVTLTASKTNLITYYHRRSGHEVTLVMINECSLGEASYHERLLGLKLTLCWSCTYDPSLRMQGKWLVPYPATVSTKSVSASLGVANYFQLFNSSLINCMWQASLILPWKMAARTAFLGSTNSNLYG